MNPALTVFLKEVTENLRDRKTVVNALVIGPLLGPIFFAIMIGFIITKQLDSAEKPLEVPVVGAEHAPNLVAWLEQQGVVMKTAPADRRRGHPQPRHARRAGAFPPTSRQQWRAGEPPRWKCCSTARDQEAARRWPRRPAAGGLRPASSRRCAWSRAASPGGGVAGDRGRASTSPARSSAAAQLLASCPTC